MHLNIGRTSAATSLCMKIHTIIYVQQEQRVHKHNDIGQMNN